MLLSWGVGSTWEQQPGLQEDIKMDTFPTIRALAPSRLPTSRWMPCLPIIKSGPGIPAITQCLTQTPPHPVTAPRAQRTARVRLCRCLVSMYRRQPHSPGLEETRQVRAASNPLRKGRKMEAINTQTGLLGSREGHEVCSKLSRDRRK